VNGTCETTARIPGISVATSTTCPPDSELPHRATRPGVNLLERAGEVDRCVPVGQLAPDIEELSRRAGAVTEIAIVEDQTGEAGVREALSEGVEALVADRTETVGHDNARMGAFPVWRVQPSSASRPA
jgi:hypothetical protein